MPGRVVIFGWADSIHVQRWVRGMTGRGFQVRLISLGGEPVSGVDCRIIPRGGPWTYFTQATEAARLAKEFCPDLIHVHYAGGFSWWGMKCPFAPLLVSVWGSDVAGLTDRPIRRLMTRRTFDRATRVSATSDYLKRACVDAFPGFLHKFVVVPFGVELPVDTAPMPEPPLRLCYLKLHRPVYGPDILIRALDKIRRTVPDARLTMAGAGKMTGQLRRMTKDLGLEPLVKFVGMIPHERVYSFLQEHHILVMPSREEAFGVAALEAAACGRPTVATRVGGVPEVILDGETGILIPPNDPDALAEAVLRLAQDFESCRRMGVAGRRLVREKYTWNDSLDRMTQLYESAIHG